jgi:hypothetical protein
MMNRRRTADAAEELDQDDAASVARSLQKDFIGLIAIFDRQLANGSAVRQEAQSKISDARAAAERGLKLSQELVDLLRTTP